MSHHEVAASSSPLFGSPNAKQTTVNRMDKPTYAAVFRCIGASCEDMCCRDWAIPLDKETYKQYQKFPPAKLGNVVSQYVSINATEGAPDSRFARILPAPSGSCPFFGPDRLCAIQKEYGGKLLSSTCSTYPRALNTVEGVLEGSLMLSCPEAARNVLLTPHFMQVAGNLVSGEFRTDAAIRLANNESSPIHKPYGYFHQTRALLIDMVRDRTRPMWQRLLLIGSLCKSLDDLTDLSTDEGDRAVLAILQDHREALGRDVLRADLGSVPGQLELKLKVILKLTDARVQDKESGARFRDVFWDFVEGIGSGMDSGSPNDVERYREAEERYYRPFFSRFPFILENYMLNYIFQNLFPFGRENSIRLKPRSVFDEYILLATQFAWIDALLVGVAGRHKESFAGEHVVQVVQSFCRAVEHNSLVLNSIFEFVAHLQLNTLEGMAILLR